MKQRIKGLIKMSEPTYEEKIFHNEQIKKLVQDFLSSLPSEYCSGIYCDVCPLDLRIKQTETCIMLLRHYIK